MAASPDPQITGSLIQQDHPCQYKGLWWGSMSLGWVVENREVGL